MSTEISPEVYSKEMAKWLDDPNPPKYIWQTIRLIKGLYDAGRWKRGIQSEIAEKTGYSKGRVSLILSGKAPANDRFIISVCKIYGISPDFVIKNEGPVMLSPILNVLRFEDAIAAHVSDPVLKEAFKELLKMNESMRWRAVSILKEMNGVKEEPGA